MVPRVFAVPGLGCFQFPDSGLLFRNGRCFLFPARGDGMAVFVVPVRYFFLLLCFSLSFFFLSFPISTASALLPVIIVSFPPFLASFFLSSSCGSFYLPSVLPFLASCLASFPFLPFPSLYYHHQHQHHHHRHQQQQHNNNNSDSDSDSDNDMLFPVPWLQLVQGVHFGGRRCALPRAPLQLFFIR